jgi:hypothetical protein
MAVAARNAYSRVFLIERRARGDRAPVYHSSLVAGSLEQSLGDLEKIEVPDPDNYGSFLEIGTIRGSEERATTSLSGRYAADLASTLIRLAKIKCDSDVQIHFGACQNPASFNEFDKNVILEGAAITSVSTDELGTLESGDQAAVNESAELSAKQFYEVLPLKFSERGAAIVTGIVSDMAIFDSIGCGECDDESDGCSKVYGVTETAPGSAGTPMDLLYSPDGGLNWYATDVDGSAAEGPAGVWRVNNYVGVTSDTNALYYILQSALAGLVAGTSDPSFTQVTTGFVATKTPNDSWSTGSKVFIAAEGGYVYVMTDPTAGVTVLDAGNATTQGLNAIHSPDGSVVVAGGDSGAVVFSTDGVTFSLVATAPSAQNINAVWAVNKRVFWVGTADGKLYYTTDQGATWTEKTFTGSGSGVVTDIAFATDSVMYLVHNTTVTAGRVLRSYDAGYSFVVMPEGTASMVVADGFNAVAACKYDANLAVVGGDSDGTDGVIVRGVD